MSHRPHRQHLVSTASRPFQIDQGRHAVSELYEVAVRGFWTGRSAQAARQQAAGKLDAGLRGAVTGGGHLDPLRDLIADVFIEAGFKPTNIFRSTGIVLPGYYRPAKKWDLVVVENGRLVAAIELKSQVGPSFGNNTNNRTEEAIGNAVDVWRAFEEGTFGSLRPWLGYVFLLEEAPGSTKAVSVPNALYPVESIFHGTSYKDRYRILCDRLVKERLYDAAWFLTAVNDDNGAIHEPDLGLNFASFRAAITGRAAHIKALNE
jgi:hypothetical protein